MAVSPRSVAADAWAHLRSVGAHPESVALDHVLMRAEGLTGGPLRALRALPDDEPTSMRELAARLGCDNSYVTPLVDALERGGLAVRQTHPTDRRVKVVVLTEQGRRVAERARETWATPPSVFARLDAEETATLRDLLAKLDG